MTDPVWRRFQSPGNDLRGKPFWSWNGELDEAELIRQIGVMREMGMGGFFMHSRTGLVTEYLGEEWFRLTNACADEAARLGMEAWLYDEDRWPSGTAGGMVTEDPRHRAKFVTLHALDDFAWDRPWLAAFADGRRLATGEGAKGTVHAFVVEPIAPSSFYNGNTDVDRLSRAATERFLELTHERYVAECGDRLGGSIRGIFTDEPHRQSAMTGFGQGSACGDRMAPWTEALPAVFQARFGYDLVDRLPELFLGEGVSPVKWAYMETLQTMFLENFMRPVYEWCDAHGLRLTGHALHEDSLTAQAAMQGSLMRCYEWFHDPGVDVLTEGNRSYWIVKQLASAARQLGRRTLLSELYGCTGWQMSFESHKAVGDWQALLGINLRCHHLSWFTMKGEAKRDFPGSILHQSAWWPDYDHVETYFSRLGAALGEGERRCDVLVLSPIESVWAQVRVGWAEGLSPVLPAVQELERRYAELFGWLMGGHVDFDYADEAMLATLGSVEDGELRVGEAAYRVVLVGGLTTIRSSTLSLLERFEEAGGEVVFVGEPPTHVDALPATLDAEALPWEAAPLLDACRAASRHDFRVEDGATGEPLPAVFLQARSDGDRTWVAILNTRSDVAYPDVRILVPSALSVEEWDCRTGERFGVSSEGSPWSEARSAQGTLGEPSFIPTSLARGGERVFVLNHREAAALPSREARAHGEPRELGGPVPFSLDEPNVLVLDRASFWIDGDAPQPATEILKIDQAVRRRLDLPLRGGEMVQSWYRAKQGPADARRVGLTLAFEFLVRDVPTALSLALEDGERFEATLNGRPFSTAPTGEWWVDRAFGRVPLPVEALVGGVNSIVLRTTYDEAHGLEAIYLLGEFGVGLPGPTIRRLPETVDFGDLVPQGLPFYGGRVTYRLEAPEEGVLRLDGMEAACARVGGQVVAFPPFTAEVERGPFDVEVVLTRRNTFGPLHQIPARAFAYGPLSFLTEGEAFSAEPVLLPSGLLEPPTLSARSAS